MSRKAVHQALTPQRKSRTLRSPGHVSGRKSATAALDQACEPVRPRTRYFPTVRGETRMRSFSFNSLTIRSSPQVAFPTAISRISCRRSLGRRGSSRWPGFPSPKQAKSLPVPTDERIRFYLPQSIAPSEHPAQNCHHPARGIIGPSLVAPGGNLWLSWAK
jgi:hypothetical protein